MKKFYLPLALAAAFTMASCSSENEIPGNGDNTPTIDLSNGGYVKLNVNMPSTQGSRDIKYEDGLPNEYGVKDATLILFKGTAESSSTFFGAYTLDNSNFSKDDQNSHITVTKRITTTLKGNTTLQAGERLYALVVLNNQGLISADAQNELVWSANVDHSAYDADKSFTGFQTAISQTDADAFSPADIASKGIFMTNAPLSTAAGGDNDPSSGTVQTLADVTTNIYTTETAANNSPAAEIYVERAVAKVTLNNASTTGELTAHATQKIAYKVTNWTLDMKNINSYLVRNYSTSWSNLHSEFAGSGKNKYRFVDNSSVNPNAAVPLYRTMFAKDPEYDEATPATDKFTHVTATTAVNQALGDNAPLYCKENTFKVTGQNQNQTTRAIIAVQLSEPGQTSTFDQDLYTVNGNKDVVYTKATLEARALNALASQNSTVKNFLQNKTAPTLTITFANNDQAGKIEITEGTISAKNGVDTETQTVTKAELDAVIPNIVRYLKGVSYYAVRIKHFGDEATPWNVAGQNVASGSNASIYPGGNDNYFLGRYGVVRNNWYDLSVTGVVNLGDATIPTTDETPDDVLNNYIAVSINVLSWAKHSQGSILQ